MPDTGPPKVVQGNTQPVARATFSSKVIGAVKAIDSILGSGVNVIEEAASVVASAIPIPFRSAADVDVKAAEVVVAEVQTVATVTQEVLAVADADLQPEVVVVRPPVVVPVPVPTAPPVSTVVS